MSAKRIYIVEDEPLIAHTIKIMLEKQGYEICGMAEDAKTTLNDLENNTPEPDLLLLDVNLEGNQDGILLAEHLQKNYNFPFVFLTSFSDATTLERIQRTNTAGIIQKPFNESSLAKALNNLI